MQWYRRIDFRIYVVAALAASVFIGAFVSRASAQETRTIRLILPFPPGGPADVMARLVAAQIGELGGPTMVVESHPGAATEIGSLIVAHAAPDGNTLGIISPSFVVLPHFRKVGYEPLKEFVPICELATFPPLLAVNSQSPYRTLKEFVDAAHAHPGTLTLGTIGPSSATQLAFEMFKRAAKADITFVPFTGYTPAIQALLGNQITAAIADYSSLQAEIRSDKLRPLATTAPDPVSTLPQVPTMEAAGYHGVEAEFYGGVVAPAGTPEAKISSLIHWFTAALQTPQVKAKYKALGFFSGGQCGANFAAILREDNRKYGQTVADAHLQMH
jgi:tripartite-type tricarboxylate transporter receptor subunit TctC